MDETMKSALRILHLEDDPVDIELIQSMLIKEGIDCELHHVVALADFVAALEEDELDLILADYSLPSFDGLTALALAREKRPEVPFILVSGQLGEELAIESLRAGATDYVLKHRMTGLIPAVRRALREAEEHTQRQRAEEELRNALVEVQNLKEQLEAENVYLREEIRMAGLHSDIIGQSEAMKSVLVQAEQVAETDSTVLILGETGTGKELLARAIHNMSGRRNSPLVVVNCAAMPSALVEGELFGREKGAYTGAITRQTGRFEVAHGSTIFLDEVGELPIETQVKLLRVLQEGQFERLGGTRTTTVDVRVVAATNRNLEKAVEEGSFREDLFYRLNVFPIVLPPLRDHVEDIPPLVWSFVNEFAEKMGKRIESVSRKSMAALQGYQWPGNVRELRNIIERAMIRTTDGTLHMPDPGRKPGMSAKGMTLEEVERDHIVDILKRTNWRVSGKRGAAEILGLKPTTLESKLARLGIKRPDRNSR
jgi:formate hydrogenlyase transcriptional activator